MWIQRSWVQAPPVTLIRPVGQAAKLTAFHAVETSSILVRGANLNKKGEDFYETVKTKYKISDRHTISNRAMAVLRSEEEFESPNQNRSNRSVHGAKLRNLWV